MQRNIWEETAGGTSFLHDGITTGSYDTDFANYCEATGETCKCMFDLLLLIYVLNDARNKLRLPKQIPRYQRGTKQLSRLWNGSGRI